MSYRSQAVASTFVGTPLAVALCALYAQFGPGAPATNFIMAIFLLVPIWSAILVWGLKRDNPRTAWIGLVGALAVIGTILFIARKLLGE